MSKVNTMLLILDSQHLQKKKILPNIFFFRLFTPVSFHWGLSFGYNTFYDWDWISVGKVLVL